MQEATIQEKEQLEKIKEKCLNCQNVHLAKHEQTLFFQQEFQITNLC